MYRITAENVKIHWTSTESLAKEVVVNLLERYNIDACLGELTKKEFCWNIDNTSFLNDPHTFKFELDGDLVITCKSQHWDEFKRAVLRNLGNVEKANKKYGGKFYKLHSLGLHTIVLTEIQKDQLHQMVVDQTIKNDQIAKNAEDQMSGIDLIMNRNNVPKKGDMN